MDKYRQGKCPFCDSENTLYIKTEMGRSYIICLNCFAQGPSIGFDPEEAINKLKDIGIIMAGQTSQPYTREEMTWRQWHILDKQIMKIKDNG